jgi:hypothetical protein
MSDTKASLRRTFDSAGAGKREEVLNEVSEMSLQELIATAKGVFHTHWEAE